MREVEIGFAPETAVRARSWIVRFAAETGLEVAAEGTLSRYKGCLHWHLRKPGAKGTLEATWNPATGRFWFKVASNRDADWIDQAIARASRLA